MTWRRRGKPYIRRARAEDYTASLRIAFKMAGFAMRSGPQGYFVLVQHGIPNKVLAAAGTKREIQQSMLAVWSGAKSWAEWQRSVHRQTGLGKYRKEA